jgi:hypothetical protein
MHLIDEIFYPYLDIDYARNNFTNKIKEGYCLSKNLSSMISIMSVIFL